MWSFSLPLVLVGKLGATMIPCVAVICWALLCIEEVGNMIEDPFNMPFLFKDSGFRDELGDITHSRTHIYTHTRTHAHTHTHTHTR